MNKNKIRLSYHLKLWNNKKLVLRLTTSKKMKIINKFQVSLWQKAYLKVTYCGNKGLYNDGFYYSSKSLREALAIFTEKELLDYISQSK